jgi:hypothetical protein
MGRCVEAWQEQMNGELCRGQLLLWQDQMNGANARGLEMLIIAEDFRQRRPNESEFLVAHTARVLLPFHWIHSVQQRNERQAEVQFPVADQPDHLVMIEHAAVCRKRVSKEDTHTYMVWVGRTDKRSPCGRQEWLGCCCCTRV